MKEIKFRVFDKNEGMFLVDTLIGTTRGMRVGQILQKNEDCGALEPWGWEYSDADVLMQYTGLKDKNEIEIYEGDIVKFLPQNIFGEVKILGKSLCFGIAWSNSKTTTFTPLLEVECEEELEVIGNIFHVKL